MRILAVTPTYFPQRGGAEVLIHEVYRRLGKRHTVQIVTPFPSRQVVQKSELDQHAGEGAVPVFRFRDRVSLLKLPGQRLLQGVIPPFSLSAMRAVRTAAQEFRPDVIHAFYAIGTGLAAVLGQRSARVPMVLSFIGRDIPGPGTPFAWKYYDQLIASQAREVTYISDYCRNALMGKSVTKGRTIYGAVDVDVFDPGLDGNKIRRELGIEAEARVLFALQRLAKEKNTDVLIRGMRHVLDEEPHAILVVGGKGPEMAKLVRLTGELGLADRVRFAGFVPEADLPLYYSMADVFVFHSTYETFGIVLAEAMASGRPIVSVRSSAIPEIIDDGITGLLVEVSNPEALAKGILTLLRDRELAARLGQAARDKATQMFNWERVTEQYEDTLRHAAGE